VAGHRRIKLVAHLLPAQFPSYVSGVKLLGHSWYYLSKGRNNKLHLLEHPQVLLRGLSSGAKLRIVNHSKEIEYQAKIIKSNLGFISISTDSAQKNTYSYVRLHRNSQFSKELSQPSD